ncbi:MAG: ABC transporter permease [Flavobacteriales bacterium]|nr:ABC transporter permease [Flavobacteriales bacterium]
MIARFFLFEVRYWLRQPMVYIFLFILALLTFGATASESVSIGGGVGNVYKNAPYVAYQWYGAMSFLAILMVTAFVNGTAIRDFTSNTAQIVFSTPVSKAGYLIGKFLGSVFIATLPLLGTTLGIVLGSAMPWVDELRVGPTLWLPHLQGFLVIGLPNILFAGAIIFAVGIHLRSTMASFITAIALFVGYSIAGSFMSDIENEFLGAMVDPWGSSATALVTKYWTVEDKNSLLLPMNGVLLWNRLLWIGVSFLIFFAAYWRFSFTDRSSGAKAAPAEPAAAGFNTTPIPAVTLHHDRKADRQRFWDLFRTDLKGILKSTPFIIIMGLGLLQLFVSLAFVTSMYGNTTYPVTYNVTDMIGGSLFIYLMIIVTFYAGQLVWKERDARIDGVINALPMTGTTNLLAKLCALIGVVVVVHLFAALAGMVTQLLNGYTRLQPMVYLTYYIIPGVLQFTLWAVLALLVHVLVNNKYLGFFVFILVVVLNMFIWSVLDVESNLVHLFGSTGLVYSDMNGFGPYLKHWLFFRAYWMVFAAILLYVAYLFFVRGNDTTMRWRGRLAKQRFAASRPLAFGLVGVFAVLAGIGFYNTKVLNHYTSSDEMEDLQVRYEKEFKRFEGMPQPHYTDITFTIDLVPEERAIRYTADVVMKNKSDRPIDTLYFNLPSDMDVVMDIPGATIVLDDKDLDQRMYRLATPLAPGAEIAFPISGGWQQKGIENSVTMTGIVDNGSFFNHRELLPGIGYNAGFEISDRADRRKHELPPNRRMPRLSDDPGQRMHNYLMSNSDWVHVRTTISTAPDQIAIAPGSLKKEWTENGRRYFRYELDHAAMNFYSFMSARYEVAREEWKAPDGATVDLEVYYQKEHGVNVPRMMNSMRKSLEYYSANFGPYKHKQARIIEFPRYASFAQAFPGTMPYSEAIGFITDLTAKEDIDMVFYVVAHEMGHQWWAHQVMGADMQGSTLLSESMSQYSALMVMEQEYGRAHMRKFMKYEGDKYQNARGAEAIGETPLMEVENQGYIHYNKGSVMLYGLREYLGEDTLNKAFRALVDSFGYAEPPWPTALDFYRAVRKVTPDSLVYLLDDNLKHITLYNNKVEEATARMLPDSTYEVSLKLWGEKNHSDSLGRETPATMNDWIDVSILRYPAFGAKADKSLNDVPLLEKRVRLKSGWNELTFVVDGKPLKAVIDRSHLFFDKEMSDNEKKVEVK